MTNEKATHLDLFSGIGGFALAAGWAGFNTIGFCETEPYARKVIEKNFAPVSYDPCDGRRQRRAWRSYSSGTGKLQQPLPFYRDIRSLPGSKFAGVELITGGFPCQPFSCAGKRRGKEDDRHLWPEMLRVIKEARPAWVLGENVTGIIGMELDSVLSDLEANGYSAWSFVVPACGVDAKHRRNRVWIIANDDSSLRGIQQKSRGKREGKTIIGNYGPPQPVAHTERG